MKVSELEKRVMKIESRNKKVEEDKAWGVHVDDKNE